MALDPRYVVTQDIDSFFIDKDTGLPLAGGIVTFYQDSARTILQPVYTLTGAPPYGPESYVPLPNPIVLSNVGTYQDAGGNNIVVYYYPYDSDGNLSLYYITVTDSNGNPEFTREAWPNVTSANTPSQVEPGTAESYLVGWDFPLNPFQFGASSSVTPSPPAPGAITTAPAYIVDQTIAASAAVSGIAWQRDNITNGLNFVTPNATDAFYIQQYLSGAEVQKMLGTSMSLNVNAYVLGTGLPVTMRIYLFRASSAFSIPLLPIPFAALNPDGTLGTTPPGWTAIPVGAATIPTFTLSQVLTNPDINNVSNNYGVSGYQITDSTAISNTFYFTAIVTFSYSAVTPITVNSIALVPGDTPSKPAIKSPDETLRQCQYYYQKSFIGSQVPTSAVGVNSGESYAAQTATASIPASVGIIVRFPTTIRTSPTTLLYNPVSANNQIYNVFRSTDWSSCSIITNAKTSNGFCASGITSAGSTVGDLTGVHWTADARLAVI